MDDDYIDPILAKLVQKLDSTADIGAARFPVTLTVNGVVISGDLISARLYWHLVDEHMGSAHIYTADPGAEQGPQYQDVKDPAQRLKTELLLRTIREEVNQQLSEKRGESDAGEVPKFLHVGYPQLYVADHRFRQPDTVRRVVWRGLIERVDGWSVGVSEMMDAIEATRGEIDSDD